MVESEKRPIAPVKSSVISKWDEKSKSGFKITLQENSPMLIQFQDQSGTEYMQVECQLLKDLMAELGL